MEGARLQGCFTQHVDRELGTHTVGTRDWAGTGSQVSRAFIQQWGPGSGGPTLLVENELHQAGLGPAGLLEATDQRRSMAREVRASSQGPEGGSGSGPAHLLPLGSRVLSLGRDFCGEGSVWAPSSSLPSGLGGCFLQGSCCPRERPCWQARAVRAAPFSLPCPPQYSGVCHFPFLIAIRVPPPPCPHVPVCPAPPPGSCHVLRPSEPSLWAGGPGLGLSSWVWWAPGAQKVRCVWGQALKCDIVSGQARTAPEESCVCSQVLSCPVSSVSCEWTQLKGSLLL